MELTIQPDSPSAPHVEMLISAHHAYSQEHSPATSQHTLSVHQLCSADITFWTINADGNVAGCGALKEIDPTHGEVKSMHTAASHRSLGVGRAMLEHIFKVSRQRGYLRLSLETGSMPAYAAARKLYAAFGFMECGPFAYYEIDVDSIYMTTELRSGI